MRKRKLNILLTGASKGIGGTIYDSLTWHGHTVIGVSRWRMGLGTNKQFLQADITKHTNLVFDSALGRLGKGKHFDVLINNAGITEDISIEETGCQDWEERWRKIFEVNLFAPILLTHRFVEQALTQDRSLSRVINICSRVAHRGDPAQPHYAASKAALRNFTKSMATRYAKKGIAFFSVSPCWVDTDMAKGKSMAKMIRDIPAGRIAGVRDMVPVISYLVHEAPGFTTGTDMPVNGASYF